MSRPITTYSICACDLDAGQWGVATQSKFLAVGSVVPWAEPYAGAVATQSYANPRYGPDGLALLRKGLAAEEVVERLTSADDGREQRQLGIVDAEGGSATFTGSACHEWAGGQHRSIATQPRETSSSRARPSPHSLPHSSAAAGGHWPSDCSTAWKPRRGPVAIAAANSRPRSSLSSEMQATAGLSDLLVDLRVDDHPDPITELQRLYALHQTLFGKTLERGLDHDRRRALRRDCEPTVDARPRQPRRLGRRREPRGASRGGRPDRSRRAHSPQRSIVSRAPAPTPASPGAASGVAG